MFELIFNIPNICVLVFGGYAWKWCSEKYEKTKSRPLLNCLPGVFTSLGLLGTFFSICHSLHGLDAETIDNTGKTLAEVKAAGDSQPGHAPNYAPNRVA